MKKGFTLIELLGVLVLLTALTLIIVPIISNSIDDSKEKLYKEQIESIKTSLNAWMSDHQRPNEGESITLSLSQLKEEGLVKIDIKNPISGELFPNDMILKIVNTNNIIEYVIEENGTDQNDYTVIPKIKVNGDVLEYVEINTEYKELGATAKSASNETLSNIVINMDPNFDITKLGNYLVSYTITDNNYTNVAYRTIVVRDTTGPIIEFDGDLTLKLSQVNSYDFKKDITITDNSGEEIEDVVVSDNIGLLIGSYTVTYQATDSSGNTTTKLRKVIVTE